jgi:adenosylcobinamide-phosphate synthase
MGDYIKWFENRYYKNSIFRGFILFISLMFITFCISCVLCFLHWYIQGIIASTGIASKMLYESVKDIISNPTNIKYFKNELVIFISL